MEVAGHPRLDTAAVGHNRPRATRPSRVVHALREAEARPPDRPPGRAASVPSARRSPCPPRRPARPVPDLVGVAGVHLQGHTTTAADDGTRAVGLAREPHTVRPASRRPVHPPCGRDTDGLGPGEVAGPVGTRVPGRPVRPVPHPFHTRDRPRDTRPRPDVLSRATRPLGETDVLAAAANRPVDPVGGRRPGLEAVVAGLVTRGVRRRVGQVPARGGVTRAATGAVARAPVDPRLEGVTAGDAGVYVCGRPGAVDTPVATTGRPAHLEVGRTSGVLGGPKDSPVRAGVVFRLVVAVPHPTGPTVHPLADSRPVSDDVPGAVGGAAAVDV